MARGAERQTASTWLAVIGCIWKQIRRRGETEQSTLRSPIARQLVGRPRKVQIQVAWLTSFEYRPTISANMVMRRTSAAQPGSTLACAKSVVVE